jgi:hypothetical protein
VAREVYNSFSDQAGFVPWVENGNSNKQFEARRVANRILALSPAQAEGEGDREEAAKLTEFSIRLSRLREGEGSSVTLLCDNPDFNGQPSNAIEVCGEWTNWEDRRFTGDTLHAAVLSAYRAMLSAAPKVTTPQKEWMGLAPSTTHNITIPEFPKVTI